MSGIEVRDLTVKYGEETIFKNFCLAFPENEINVVLGNSGVGKSTLLNAVAGLLPYSGAITGTERGISYIFQKDRLIPSISVFKNLDLVLRSKIKDKNERRKMIVDMLKLLEISDQIKKLPGELSGGQAQRVAMARAFLYPSGVLLLDEPFRALDTALKSRLISALLKLNKQSPRTIIFVTHAIDECLLCADNYFVFSSRPADAVLSGRIDIQGEKRTLESEELDPVRKRLLSALTQGRN